MSFIEIKGLKKSYGSDDSFNMVLKGIDLSVEKGEIVVIQGSSGSGKSTLLNCIGGLETANRGAVSVGGVQLVGMKPGQLSRYRRDYLGFIFQFYNVIPNLTVRENIQVCRYLTGDPLDMDEIVEVLGLTQQMNKFPNQLSGGQQQRCAIARALIKNPVMLLCDEPTGALDSKTSKDILVLMEKINKQYGTTMLVVTHNNAIKDMADRVVIVSDGLISKNYANDHRVAASELEGL